MREQSFSISISDHFAHLSTSLRIAWAIRDRWVFHSVWEYSIEMQFLLEGSIGLMV
jgi:hypothetical protein